MGIFDLIPKDIFIAFLTAITAILSNSNIFNGSKRNLAEYKLINIYSPIKIKLVDFYISKPTKENILNVERDIISIVEKNYSYCPDELIYLINNLKIELRDSKPSTIFIEKVYKYVCIESFYCQKIVRMNDTYALDFRNFHGFFKTYKMLFKKVYPFISILAGINMILAFINPFVKIVKPSYLLISTFMVLFTILFDYLIISIESNKRIRTRE